MTFQHILIVTAAAAALLSTGQNHVTFTYFYPQQWFLYHMGLY
jgi:hypothetical protein